jgi:hypothetical protein
MPHTSSVETVGESTKGICDCSIEDHFAVQNNGSIRTFHESKRPLNRVISQGRGGNHTPMFILLSKIWVF